MSCHLELTQPITHGTLTGWYLQERPDQLCNFVNLSPPNKCMTSSRKPLTRHYTLLHAIMKQQIHGASKFSASSGPSCSLTGSDKLQQHLLMRGSNLWLQLPAALASQLTLSKNATLFYAPLTKPWMCRSDRATSVLSTTTNQNAGIRSPLGRLVGSTLSMREANEANS